MATTSIEDSIGIDEAAIASATDALLSPQLDAIVALVEAVGTVDIAAIAAACAAEVDALGSCQAAIDSRQTSLTTWSETGAAAAISAAGLPAATATAVGAQAACDAAIAARQTSFTTWSQTGCAAAISAAALATATNLATLQSTCSALPSAADIVTAIAMSAAISTQMQAAAQAALDATDVQVLCEQAIDSKNIPVSVQTLAVGGTFLQATVTLSGAGTSGTVVAASGGNRHYIVAMLAACSVANSTFSLASSGGTTMGAAQLLIGTSLSLAIPFGYIIRGGLGTSITGNKTTGATLVITVWYYTF